MAGTCDEMAVALKVTVARACGEVERRRVQLLDPQLADVGSLVLRWARGPFVLQYTDDEGDAVTVETDDEWAECLKVWREGGADVLRLHARPRDRAGRRGDGAHCGRQAGCGAKESGEELGGAMGLCAGCGQFARASATALHCCKRCGRTDGAEHSWRCARFQLAPHAAEPAQEDSNSDAGSLLAAKKSDGEQCDDTADVPAPSGPDVQQAAADPCAGQTAELEQVEPEAPEAAAHSGGVWGALGSLASVLDLRGRRQVDRAAERAQRVLQRAAARAARAQRADAEVAPQAPAAPAAEARDEAAAEPLAAAGAGLDAAGGTGGPDAGEDAAGSCVAQLQAMGFEVTDEVRALVSRHNGDVTAVVTALF